MIITMAKEKLPPEGNELANLLYKERVKLKLSKRELAKLSGVSRTTIMLIETGQRGNEVEADTLVKLANALQIPAKPLFEAIGAKYNEPDILTGKAEDWEKHAAEGFIKVPVYPDYVQAHAGEGLHVIDYIAVKVPASLPSTIKAYRVSGDCLENERLYDGDYVIVDHDRQIDNGDKVVLICGDQVHVAKLKIIGNEYYFENKYGTYRPTDCKGIAKVIGKYTPYA